MTELSPTGALADFHPEQAARAGDRVARLAVDETVILPMLSLSIPIEMPIDGRGWRSRMTVLPPPARPAGSACSFGQRSTQSLAVDESSVTLLHPPLPSVGVSIAMEREHQRNGRTLADG